MTHEPFEASRARLSGPDLFKRFRVPAGGRPLAELDWPADADILVVERGGEHLAFLARQMSYHHLAQGELAGLPYLVSF